VFSAGVPGAIYAVQPVLLKLQMSVFVKPHNKHFERVCEQVFAEGVPGAIYAVQTSLDSSRGFGYAPFFFFCITLKPRVE